MGDWLRLYGPPLFAWALVVGRLIGPYRFDTFERRAILVCLTGVACTVTTTSPLGYLAIGDLTHIPNVARPLGHFSMLVVVSATWALMLSLSNPNSHWKSPWRTWWLLATVAAMTVAFILSDTPENNIHFASDYGDSPWVLEYWLIYISYLLPVYVILFRLTRRYAQLSARRSLRIGLHVITVGIVISAIYHVHKAVYFAALRFGWDYPAWLREPVDKYATVISMVLVLAGLTLPSWTWRAVMWLRQYRTYHRLGPLWRSLHAATPEIALSTAGFIESRLPRDLGLRLYRRVIE
ncbi:MAB_1171c family putative transporter, partial [Kibdelosporangium lantanae]